ncbi:MAG: DUF2806 domain-containing protein [Olsenella sp.]|nr:DUF2806 domain-containing protein [Olsenella sp.]MDD6706894.1 DUF2806 domain-containing protein [Olsenella sp.]
MDIGASSKFSAEANLVKFGSMFNFSGPSTEEWKAGNLTGRQALVPNFLAQTRRAINPSKYENDLAEARSARASSICDAFNLYRQTMPSLTDRQAFALACGYTLTPPEADNITAVLSMAANNADPNADPDNLSTEFEDQFIKGSAGAYDDKVRSLWASLLNGELHKPGSFSKRTLSVLQSMSREDAEAFETLASYTVAVQQRPKLIPVLIKSNTDGWSYNHEALSIDQRNLLAALGLIDTNNWTTFTLQKDNVCSLYIAGGRIDIRNASESTTHIDFGNAMFTPSGKELISICPIGTALDLQDLLAETINETAGLSYSYIDS